MSGPSGALLGFNGPEQPHLGLLHTPAHVTHFSSAWGRCSFLGGFGSFLGWCCSCSCLQSCSLVSLSCCLVFLSWLWISPCLMIPGCLDLLFSLILLRYHGSPWVGGGGFILASGSSPSLWSSLAYCSTTTRTERIIWFHCSTLPRITLRARAWLLECFSSVISHHQG